MARRQAAIVGVVQEFLRCVEKKVGGVRTIPALAVFAIASGPKQEYEGVLGDFPRGVRYSRTKVQSCPKFDPSKTA